MSYPSYAKRENIEWHILLFIAAIHIVGLGLAIYSFTWTGLIAFVVLQFVTACLGVTIGYHRMLTHSSFKAHPVLKYILATCGALSLQGGPITWVATHRLHHKESDQENDPHSPQNGFWWSHLVWNFFQHPELKTMTGYRKFAPDLCNDAGIRFLQRHYFTLYTAFAAILFLTGFLLDGFHMGLSLVVWGVLLRTIYVWHITWFVNSATHVWGYRNYNNPDTSKNLWWVALLSFGEGWHNNHHTDQTSARHGHLWFEFDMSYILINTFEKLGLATKVLRPRFQRLAVRRLNPRPERKSVMETAS